MDTENDKISGGVAGTAEPVIAEKIQPGNLGKIYRDDAVEESEESKFPGGQLPMEPSPSPLAGVK